MKYSRGFTLIELLISLVIFSLVSIAALSSVNHMMRSREHQESRHDLDEALDLAYANIYQDLMWFLGEVTSAQEELHFTRTQTSQAEGKTTVIYRVRDGQLFRAVGSSETLMLEKVKDLKLSWLSDKRQWVGAFDQAVLDNNPLLLKVQFIAPHLGEVTWVFSTGHV
jgi:prepilin-type N-terminal cleavage/methylation domain-containing protein